MFQEWRYLVFYGTLQDFISGNRKTVSVFAIKYWELTHLCDTIQNALVEWKRDLYPQMCIIVQRRLGDKTSYLEQTKTTKQNHSVLGIIFLLPFWPNSNNLIAFFFFFFFFFFVTVAVVMLVVILKYHRTKSRILSWNTRLLTIIFFDSLYSETSCLIRDTRFCYFILENWVTRKFSFADWLTLCCRYKIWPASFFFTKKVRWRSRHRDLIKVKKF